MESKEAESQPAWVLENGTINFYAVRLTRSGEDFKTINGREYKNATVAHVELDGIVLNQNRISKVYFTELPSEVQERFSQSCESRRGTGRADRVKELGSGDGKYGFCCVTVPRRG